MTLSAWGKTLSSAVAEVSLSPKGEGLDRLIIGQTSAILGDIHNLLAKE